MTALIRNWRNASSDELTSMLAEACPHVAVQGIPRNHHNFRFSIKTVSLDRLALCRYEYSAYQLIGTNNDTLHFVIALSGGTSIRERDNEVISRPFEVGYVIPPGGSFEVDVLKPTRAVGINVSAATLCEHAMVYFGRNCRPPKTIASANLKSPIGQALSRNMLASLNEIERLDDLALSHLAVTSFSELLLNLLVVSVFDPSGDAARTEVSGASAVENARLFIDAFAADAIRIADIAKDIGVSVRSLEIGFQKSVGCSPIRYLLRRRLELARTRLIAPAPQETVTMIASECGFVNVGLFAKRYRALYGELPSQTLSRARLKPLRSRH